ncbi:transglutaminase-like superfamily protein [Seiridium cupressi]
MAPTNSGLRLHQFDQDTVRGTVGTYGHVRPLVELASQYLGKAEHLATIPAYLAAIKRWMHPLIPPTTSTGIFSNTIGTIKRTRAISAMDPAVAHDLSQRFMRLMEEKRRAGPAATTNNTTTPPPSSASHNSPLPGRPDAWYQEVVALSHVPERYQRPGLLDKALETLDLGKIYTWADEIAAENPDLGHQDRVIKALLKYFKTEFFTWITSPPCSQCGSETEGISAQRPNPEEHRKGASRTEVYRCKSHQEHIERFPRYDDPETLLEWRKGRCGEWANCFTLCCLALGSRARWVWNAEDHVWTEVYSERLERWVHCDSCEEAFDKPQTYAVGWGKKMSYCLAFSSEGAQDVTRRYVRQEDQKVPRRKGPEESLKRAIDDINERCRRPDDVERLRAEDEAEERELAGYITGPTPTAPEEERPRESGSTDWKESRGEMGKK